MKAYHDLLKDVLKNGEKTPNRTGIETLSVFGRQARYDLREGFPAITTKKLYMKAVVHELLWFLQGSTNTGYLKEHGITIWDEWADSSGNLGPVYGKQWRKWAKGAIHSIDQIANVIKEIKQNPMSRRHIVTAWNPIDVPDMVLPPCHTMFQFNVSAKKELSCQLYQRSADLFLGVPFNIASYALLTHMVAQICGLQVGEFIHTIGDAHIYKNHIDQCMLQLDRDAYEAPKLWLNPEIMHIDKFTYEDIKLLDYKYHPAIKGDVAI